MLVTGEYYHIYNKGTESRTVFLDGADYFRFLLGIRGFNDITPVFQLCRYDQLKKIEKSLISKEPLVEIICYVFMSNHYHLVLRQLKDGGISKFMQKLGIGYTKYFNKRYQRKGVLFQGKYKYKHIPTDEYLLHLSRYIHLNPISFIQQGWKKKGLKNKESVFKFLIEHKWHSLPFWLEEKPCLVKLNSKVVLEQFSCKENYAKFLMSWTEKDLAKIKVLMTGN